MTRPRTNPVVHIPLYCADETSDADVRYLVEQHLACLGSYYAHENKYDVLLTTNDWRPLQVWLAYKAKTRYPFDLRLVSRNDLLQAFRTDESRLRDSTCMRTIFPKFYPIMNRECDSILHVDCDTMFLSQVDLSPLFVSPIGLIDANQFQHRSPPWCPTDSQADFLGMTQPVKPVSKWINSGVFAVRGSGFEIFQREVWHYLENLERARLDNLIHGNSDELIVNAIAVKERKAVTIVPDYRYNFVAYYLKNDPTWTERAKIVHFHSLKPDAYWYHDGVVDHSCEEHQAERLSEDFYLAVLMWFRYLHRACQALPFEFPTLSAIPLEVVEKELARIIGDVRQKGSGRALTLG